MLWKGGSFIEGSLGYGEHVVLIGADQTHEIRHGITTELRTELFVSSSYGISSALRYDDSERVPARAGLAIGVNRRF
jgi:hypothetical protein